MPTNRLGVVLREIAEADVDGSASLVDRVCVAAVSLLSLKGAGLSLMVDGELRGTAGVSEPGIAMVQELQLTLGEGPCVDAWTNRVPVLEANLADPAIVRWPVFAQAGVDAGVLAVFAFPLHLGAIRIGVLVLYRGHSGMLSEDEMAYGLVLADIATQVLLALQAGAPVDVLHEVLAGEPSHWAEVHQATGMISVQLGVSLDEAFVRLRAHVFAEGLPLRTVARNIVTRHQRFQETA
jgi:GAF domain/ANTAR domain